MAPGTSTAFLLEAGTTLTRADDTPLVPLRLKIGSAVTSSFVCHGKLELYAFRVQEGNDVIEAAGHVGLGATAQIQVLWFDPLPEQGETRPVNSEWTLIETTFTPEEGDTRDPIENGMTGPLLYPDPNLVTLAIEMSQDKKKLRVKRTA